MPNFLALPREIRDLIYAAVLESSIPSPDAPMEISELDSSREFIVGDGGGFMHPLIMYPIDPPKYNCQGLLGCNHQISQEVSEQIAFQSKDGLVYRLDIRVRPRRLWPTWTSFPAHFQHARHVEVDLLQDPRDNHGGLYGGDGGPGRIFLPLFTLLNQLLYHGPQFFYKGRLKSPISVERLTVNITPNIQLLSRISCGVDPKFTMGNLMADQRRIFIDVAAMVHRIKIQGSLYGKIKYIKVVAGSINRNFEISESKNGSELSEEYVRWGYIWGPDESFVVNEGVKSLPYHRYKDL